MEARKTLLLTILSVGLFLTLEGTIFSKVITESTWIIFAIIAVLTLIFVNKLVKKIKPNGKLDIAIKSIMAIILFISIQKSPLLDYLVGPFFWVFALIFLTLIMYNKEISEFLGGNV